MHADQKYINALLNNDSQLLKELYRKYSSKVISYIQNNNGTLEEAKDVIQETLIVIYQQARQNSLILTCPFDAYFFLLCKRRWLNKLKSAKGVTTDLENLSIQDESLEAALHSEQFERKNKLFEMKFNELGEKCKELLQLSFHLPSMEDVAEKLGVTYGYARKKKSLCMGQLTELIQQSPEYKQIKDY